MFDSASHRWQADQVQLDSTFETHYTIGDVAKRMAIGPRNPALVAIARQQNGSDKPLARIAANLWHAGPDGLQLQPFALFPCFRSIDRVILTRPLSGR